MSKHLKNYDKNCKNCSDLPKKLIKIKIKIAQIT